MHGGGEGARADAADGFTRATVLSSSPLSPAVRRLVLQLHEEEEEEQGAGRFSYEAGQWVDFFVAGDRALEGAVGGYSMCAPPSGQAFSWRRELELAVKASRHPAARWVHDPERCKPGASVRVRPGGSFALSRADAEGAALFVAGGIGVTALAAMAGELCERWGARRGRAAAAAGGGGPRRAAVLYSARSAEDLALLAPLRAWAARAAAEAEREGAAPLTLQLHVTGGGGGGEEERGRREDDDGRVAWRRGRIRPGDVRAAVDALVAPAAGGEVGGGGVGVFVCGPPAMTDELAAAAAEHPRVGQGRVYTERWW
jgi:ferredoxin-NADP reductase